MVAYDVYGFSEVTEAEAAQQAEIEGFKDKICDGNDFELAIDCSGTMQLSVTDGHGEKRTRFDVAKEILGSLAPHIFKLNNSIDLWEITSEKYLRSKKLEPPPTYNYLVKNDIGSEVELQKHLETLECEGSTPLCEVLSEALGRYVERLREDKKAKIPTKPLYLIIVGVCDSDDGKIRDIVEVTRHDITEITHSNSHNHLAIHFILFPDKPEVKKEMMELNRNIVSVQYSRWEVHRD